MKKNLSLFFVCISMLGSSLHAQTDPDNYWTSVAGAKKILDNIKESAINGMSLEDAVNNNPYIYSYDNVDQLIAMTLLDNVPLAQGLDYLAKTVAIMKILKSNNMDVDSLQRAEMMAEAVLNGRPLDYLKDRLQWRYDFFDDMTVEKFKYLSEEDVAPVIMKALSFFSRKKELAPDDITTILGTPYNEFKDGLLQVSNEMIKQFPAIAGKSASRSQIRFLRLMVLCSSSAMDQISAYIESSTDYSNMFSKALTDGVTSEDFSMDNVALSKVVKTEDISNGLENFNKITKLIKAVEK